MDATTGSDNAVPTPGTLLNDPILASRMRASAVSTADNGLWNPRSHCPANMYGSAPSWIGNGVLDRFLEDESLFGEFLRTPVSEGGVEPLVVGPPHVVVEVGA